MDFFIAFSHVEDQFYWRVPYQWTPLFLDLLLFSTKCKIFYFPTIPNHSVNFKKTLIVQNTSSELQNLPSFYKCHFTTKPNGKVLVSSAVLKSISLEKRNDFDIKNYYETEHCYSLLGGIATGHCYRCSLKEPALLPRLDSRKRRKSSLF